MVRYGGEGDSWDPGPARRRESRRSGSLEQRVDRWVSTGRQLVDGVAGARPGSRPTARVGGLGRWLEERVDWLLDDGDDWREPWQESQAPSPTPYAPAPRPTEAPAPRRRSLEAVSRRAATSPANRSDPPDWPEDESFRVPRWQRPAPALPPLDDLTAPPAPPASPGGGRPLPRSTRRRA